MAVHTCLKRGDIVQLLRAVCFALAFTTPEGEATGATLAQRARVEFDEDLIRETVKTVADVVDREYFDPKGPGKNKCPFLGVEAPVWQGARSE